MAPLVFACFVLRSAERYSNYNKWHSSVKPLGVLSYRYFVNIIWHWNLFRHFFTTFDKLLIRFVFQNSALLKQLRTYAQHVNDVFLLSPIHTTPGKLVNGVNDMLSVHVTLHVTPEKFKFRFVFLENSSSKITWSLWRHRLRKAQSSNCYPPTRKQRFKFLRFEGISINLRFRDDRPRRRHNASYVSKFLRCLTLYNTENKQHLELLTRAWLLWAPWNRRNNLSAFFSLRASH